MYSFLRTSTVPARSTVQQEPSFEEKMAKAMSIYEEMSAVEEPEMENGAMAMDPSEV